MPFLAENKYSTSNDMTTFKSTHLRNIPSKIRDSMELYNPNDPIFEISYQPMQAPPEQDSEDFFDYNKDDDEEFNYQDHDDSDYNDDDGDCFDDDYEPEHSLTPFWFGNEDKEQLKAIIQVYTKALKLDEEAKTQIRAPQSFVGRIKRIKVSNEKKFTTLDTVDIFTRSLLAPGSVMPLKRRVHTITDWSVEEGLPEKVSIVTDKSEKDAWLEKEDLSTDVSYLFSLPVYGSKHLEFAYLVSDEQRDVTYSPDSMCCKVLYSIPEEKKVIKELNLDE